MGDEATWIAWVMLTQPSGGHGMSAMNAARMAFGAKDDGCLPHDRGDLLRCRRLASTAPERVREHMSNTIDGWERKLVSAHTEQAIELIKACARETHRPSTLSNELQRWLAFYGIGT